MEYSVCGLSWLAYTLQQLCTCYSDVFRNISQLHNRIKARERF